VFPKLNETLLLARIALVEEENFENGSGFLFHLSAALSALG